MKIAVTGHRSEDCESEYIVRSRMRAVLDAFRPEVVYIDMANGTDLWTGDEALELGLSVVAVKPWAGHKPRKSGVELYAKIIENASEVVNVHESLDYPGAWVYHTRNEYMVDHATHDLAYLNRSAKSGGTFSCVKYARNEAKKPVKNVYAKS